jgi:hypothetical protein
MSKIQVNEIVNHFDNGAPDCPKGLTVTGVSTFSGNVSIGGTLSYEDVTNIDSVGIITAQGGVHVSGGSIGIGTAIGAIPLHIFNSVSTVKIRIDGDSNDAIMSFANSGSGIGAIGIAAGAITSGGTTNIGLQSNNNLLFATGGLSESMRLDSSGRLLIGTASARTNYYGSLASNLQVQGSSFAAISCHATAGNGAFILGRDSVISGSNIGNLSWQVNDGSTMVQAASISAAVDGTPGAGDMPGRLLFSTTPDGSTDPLERMRIDSSGMLLVGTNSQPSGSNTNLRADFGKANSGTDIASISVGSGSYRIFNAMVPAVFGSAQQTATLNFQFSQNYGIAVIEIDLVGGLAQIGVGKYVALVDCDTASGQTAQLSTAITTVTSVGYGSPVFSSGGASVSPTFSIAFTRSSPSGENWANYWKATVKTSSNSYVTPCVLTSITMS